MRLVPTACLVAAVLVPSTAFAEVGQFFLGAQTGLGGNEAMDIMPGIENTMILGVAAGVRGFGAEIAADITSFEHGGSIQRLGAYYRPALGIGRFNIFARAGAGIAEETDLGSGPTGGRKGCVFGRVGGGIDYPLPNHLVASFALEAEILGLAKGSGMTSAGDITATVSLTFQMGFL
jgi:hypothetical protein